jgi:uncharacterized protein (TIGR03437 family)
MEEEIASSSIGTLEDVENVLNPEVTVTWNVASTPLMALSKSMLWKSLGLAAILCGILSISAPAQNLGQNFDTSGNGTLKGAYFVRHILLSNINQTTSAAGRARSLTGTMTFDGNGSYSFTGQLMDSQTGSAQAYTSSGSYSVAANGLTQIQSPIDSTDTEYGGVAGIGPSAIVASATEGSADDVFVAIPAGSSITNSSVQGKYQVGFIDYLQGNVSQVRDGYFTMTSNGSGSFGNVTVNGAMANQSSNNTTQSLSGITYSITGSNGSGTITFPTSSTPLTALVSGQKTFYVSQDGNILLGGSFNGFDLMVGVKGLTSPATNSLFQGTYYDAALENDASDLSNGNNNVDSFYGSTLALGDGNSIFHDRLAFFNQAAYDYTADGVPIKFGSDGTYNDGLFQNMLGANGQAILAVGSGTSYSLIVGFKGKQYSGTTVFIDPLKVWNAANYAPITNSVAPGEFISIFGSGLSSTTMQAVSFPIPTNLGGVQVMVNGRPAALTYVSATQINLIVPYATGSNSESYAYFQVINNGVASNQVMLYTNNTAPGVFTLTQNGGSFDPGVGPAAVTHADNSLVTPSNPAKVGDTLVLYVTGLGSVTPAVADGVSAPSSPLSTVNAAISVFVDGQQATVLFKGLAPGFAGLYQLNFIVPSGITSGSLVYVDISTPEAYASEAKIYTQ